MTTNEPADHFERELRDVWKQLSRSIARSRAVFEALGAAMLDEGAPEDGQLARSVRSYEVEESHVSGLAAENLGKLLKNAREGRETLLLSAAWRAVNEIEHVAGCGMRLRTLAVRGSEGGHSFGDGAKKDAEKLSGHIEELFYWTLEAMRLRHDNAGWERRDLIEAEAIARKEGAIARRVFDKAAAACAGAHSPDGASGAEGRCSVPAGAAFLDYIATLSRAGGHLSALLELSGSQENA